MSRHFGFSAAKSAHTPKKHRSLPIIWVPLPPVFSLRFHAHHYTQSVLSPQCSDMMLSPEKIDKTAFRLSPSTRQKKRPSTESAAFCRGLLHPYNRRGHLFSFVPKQGSRARLPCFGTSLYFVEELTSAPAAERQRPLWCPSTTCRPPIRSAG